MDAMRKPPPDSSVENCSWPLCVAQADIWFGQKLAPGETLYNIAGYVEIFGPVDRDISVGAIRQGLSEADSLRLRFEESPDGPRQVFSPITDAEVPFVDLSSSLDPHADALAWMKQALDRPFNLATGPLYRVALLKLSDERFHWFYTCHHIVADLFGGRVFLRKVADLYNAAAGVSAATGVQLTPWSEVLADEADYRASARYRRDREYWLEQLQDRPSPATLAGLAPRRSVSVIESVASIRGSTYAQLDALGGTCKAGVMAVLYCAVATYMARTTGQQDLILGMPVAARVNSKLRHSTGVVTNTVPLRLHVDLAMGFRSLVDRVGVRIREAGRHQRYWSSALRSDLGLAADDPALYTVILNFVPNDVGFEIAGNPVRLSTFTHSRRVDDLMITVHAREDGSDVRVHFGANGQHYDQRALQEHQQNFLRLLDDIVNDPTRPVGLLQYLEDAQRQRILRDWSGTGRTADPVQWASAVERFAMQVRRDPQAPAAVLGERGLSYGELDARADQVAQRLLQQGVGPGCILGLWADRSLEMLIGLLGIWKAGGAYLPLDPAYPAQRLEMMLADARPLLVVGSAAAAEAELASRIPLLRVSLAGETASDGADRELPQAGDPAYVIYTSGSTGTPKGVVVTHAGLVTLAASLAGRMKLKTRSRVLQLASLNFDVSASEVLMALLNGAALVLAPATAVSGEALRELLIRQRITHLSVTPSVLATLEKGEGLSLECLVVGGEECPPELIDRWSAGVRMINAYGPTESTVCATMSAPLAVGMPAPIGTPIEGTRVYVLDAGLEPVSPEVVGELYIAGAGLACGYLHRPGLTAERFVADPYGEPGSRMYRSGDLARWRDDGVLEYLGRADQQVKVRGHRIELEEIEAALCAAGPVEQAAVAVREDRAAGKYLAAYLVLRAGQTLDVEQLRIAMSQRLPQYMVPALFMPIAALPLGLSGKLDRRALADVASAVLQQVSYEPPQTPTERRLAAIWCQVLRCERVGRSENFFHVGGQSLLALQVVARVREAFGLELSLKSVFDSPRLKSQAAVIDRAVAAGQARPLAPIVAVHDEDAAPLSYSQERMWLIQNLNPQTTAYNMAAALWIRGPLDVTVLAHSLDDLVARHDVLRSRIRIVNDQPQQWVEPRSAQLLTTVDLRDRPDAQAEAVRLAQVDSRVVFDLERDPVIRTRLFETARDECLLSLVIHHVAGDQWSLGLLGRELAVLYNGYTAGTHPQLPPLPLTYRDFARWQRSETFSGQFEGQLQFWMRQLADLPAVELPIDHARPKVWTLNGAVYQRPISPALFNAIQEASRAAGGTAFMTLFTGFAVLLHRLSGQTDLPIGVPVANRTHSAVEGLIGTFVNTLVLRTDLRGDPQFRALFQRVRTTVLEAFQNPDVSFDRLVQELGQRGDRSRAPLVQVMFNVANAPMHGLEFAGLTWEPLLRDGGVEGGDAQFELNFSVDTEVTRSLTVGYNTDLFTHATIERLVAQYFTILEAAVAAPQLRISTLPLLPPEQWVQLQAWNASQPALPQSLTFPCLFEAQAARSPDATAIAFAGESLSYAQLDARSNRFARLLKAAGVARGAKVGVCVRRSPLLLISLLAVQKSGGAYVPLDPEFPAERLKYMLSDSGVSVVVTAGALPADLQLPDGIRVLDVADLLRDSQATSADDLSDGPVAADLAYLLYTSGSTGRPKGVSVSHGALANFLMSMRERPGLAAGDVLAAVTTISFDIVGLELYLPLIVGARIELVSRQVASDGHLLAQLLESSAATVLQATPATWRLLLEVDWRPTRPFRALCGGEALSRKLADELLERVGELWNMYGPTETTIWSTLDKVERDGAAISIGRPIGNTQVHILDPAGEPVPIGVAGEICIGGAGVAQGYLGRPGLTAERFVPDPFTTAPGARLYRTGDLGRWAGNGKLYHLGRSDHQVKIRGYRIELGEIEKALSAQPSVQHAVATVREARADDPRLVAFVKYREGQDATVGDLKRELRVHLPDYMVPSIIVSVDAMPLTPNGKVDRAALPNPFAATVVEDMVHEPPVTPMEQVLAEIWKSVLNVERVGALDNFFELGGYSLLSLRVTNLVEKRTGRQLDPRALFFQNLREIAANLESLDSPSRAAVR